MIFLMKMKITLIVQCLLIFTKFCRAITCHRCEPNKKVPRPPCMQNKAFFSFQLCPIESTACYNINTETLDGLKVTMSGCSSKKSSLSENYPLICEEKQLPGFTKGAFCHCFEDYCNYNGSNSIHTISISLKIIMITVLSCSN